MNENDPNDRSLDHASSMVSYVLFTTLFVLVYLTPVCILVADIHPFIVRFCFVPHLRLDGNVFLVSSGRARMAWKASEL